MVPKPIPTAIQINANADIIKPNLISTNFFGYAIKTITRAFPQSISRLINNVRYKSKPKRTNNTGTINGHAVNPMALAANPINIDIGMRSRIRYKII